MNIVEIENQRQELLRALEVSSSQREKVLMICRYYNHLLKSNDENLIESYIIEFIETYLNLFTHYDPIGINPSISEELIETTKLLTEKDFLGDFKKKATRSLEEKKIIYEKLISYLRGDTKILSADGKQYIPVLEEKNNVSEVKTGFLETISVHLRKTKEIGKFIIVPSGKELEKRLIAQVEMSWEVAVKKSKKYLRKKNDPLNVVISFDNRLGYYTGDSLGTALAILFLEELLIFYNSPIIINKKNIVAITGGIDKESNILPVSEIIIKEKTEVVFYSGINLFVVPKQDEAASKEKLEKLKSQYPERKLKILSVEDFDDVLNRRDIVEIRKQKIILRTAKFAIKNWAAVLFFVMVIFLVYVGHFYDFNTNPVLIEQKGYWLHVQNKNGKELWKKRMGFSADIMYDNQMKYVTQKIIDVDNDGTNEVILTREDPKQYIPAKHPSSVTCFSWEGEQVWKYNFRDTIASIDMIHSNFFASFLIDTITINESKAIACFANNVLYPSAVYFLNLKTGERIGTTLWNVGHLHSGIFKDLNEDGRLELIMSGLNNSLGRVIIFSIDIDKIGGQLPAIGDRIFKELPAAEVNNYVVLPKSDYTNHFGLKFNEDGWGGVKNLNIRGLSLIYLYEGQKPDYKGIVVELNKDLTVKGLDISEGFQIARDALVESGDLQAPYSATKEYHDILFEQIRYWDGQNFVRKLIKY